MPEAFNSNNAWCVIFVSAYSFSMHQSLTFFTKLSHTSILNVSFFLSKSVFVFFYVKPTKTICDFSVISSVIHVSLASHDIFSFKFSWFTFIYITLPAYRNLEPIDAYEVLLEPIDAYKVKIFFHRCVKRSNNLPGAFVLLRKITENT